LPSVGFDSAAIRLEKTHWSRSAFAQRGLHDFLNTQKQKVNQSYKCSRGFASYFKGRAGYALFLRAFQISEFIGSFRRLKIAHPQPPMPGILVRSQFRIDFPAVAM